MGEKDTQAATVVELAEVIEGLRSELEKAQAQGEGKQIRFGVKDIELELNLTIAKKVKGGGKAVGKVDLSEGLVKYLVGKVGAQIDLSAEGEYQKVSEQKIKLSLAAKNADDSNVNLAGDDR
ncbi:MAG: trypco2 family protein [Candidatus Electrothrix sp. GW3-4]|uniref:trypco2 family protein n=1 Tax=Candidatus Electrothrix sp. GW3-4 TaxID=3126740 RepID=UPI0030CCF133